ncbi:Hok/Gef family protein [Erwiniaceae bacterium BAC15a-03b]|uniref:Hok/Gef family protein n=1 Tax=Winslowiella arboricola TaxID=2978220 RepID=A0A9J6PLK0_9GAMM|nr:Hok/Gef family protein [Winslowiella arboricola]MCU5771771.1 Hok/Gef family protein [Winslowiella arboricola]MCU5776621.1 Hok/Gef family protein [Winslowiella arboricola]
MAAKLFILSVIFIYVTFFTFTFITRGSLCEMSVKYGGLEVVARLACESIR